MNETEKKIMSIISEKPDGISSLEIESHFLPHQKALVIRRLTSLWKYGFIDRTNKMLGIEFKQYYWRIHREGNRNWTADFIALVGEDTDLQYKERMAELMHQEELLEIWA